MTPSRHGTVLIADDDPANLRLLSELLRKEGYDVRAARDGQSAVRSATAAPPDAVLLDVHMPGLDGYETCRRLKAEPDLREIPVLFLSGLAEPFNRAMAFEVGAVDYVVKPFEPVDVLARLGVHIRLRQVNLQLAEQNTALAEQKELQNRLFSMIAHDMRSPLTGVLGSLELLSTDERELPEWAAEYVSDATAGAQRIHEMVADLLAVHNLEEGVLQPTLESGVAPAAVIQAALRPLVRTERERVRVEVEASSVRCDRSLLMRVVANLVQNALRYSPSGEQVLVTCKNQGDDLVRLEVADAGPGIPETMHTQVFDKFFSTNRSNGSSGLGLTFCRLAVGAQHGHIGVGTLATGGALFWIEMPRS